MPWGVLALIAACGVSVPGVSWLIWRLVVWPRAWDLPPGDRAYIARVRAERAHH